MNNHLKSIDYIQRTTDIFIVLISWGISYYIKFFLEVGEKYTRHDDKYLFYSLLLVLVSTIVFKNSKLYDSIRFEHISKEIISQIKANFISLVVFAALAFFLSKFRLSRIVLVSHFTISSILLVLSKMYFRKLIAKKPSKVVLVGAGKAMVEYYEKIKELPNFAIEYWVNAPSDIANSIDKKDEINYKNLESSQINAVVIGRDLSGSDQMAKELKELGEYIVPVIVLPDLQYSKIGHSFSKFKGQTLIHYNDPNPKMTNLIIKRAFDIFAVSIGMIAISPLLFLLGLLVKLTSKGPIFYGQVRMGVDGAEFKMWKFRSMVVGEANQEGWTVKNDPRVTPIGKFIRKTSLDELPQLWNVLVGDMSLVGPRPERPVYVDQFRQEIPSYMLRHKFKAGITGWAQINGWRGDTSIEKRIECDLWYIKNWSIGLDIYILFATFWKGFVNKNAY